MKIINKILLNNGKNKEREIQFLGFPLFQYGKKEGNGTKERYFEIFPKSLEHKALDKILKFIPKDSKHDHIWIVRTLGLGEAQLLNFMMDELVKKWKVKNPCFVSHRKIYKEMFGMYTKSPFYFIDIPYNDYALYLQNRNIKYKGKYFHVYHCTPEESFTWLKQHRCGDCSSAVDAIKKWSDVTKFSSLYPKFSDQVKKSAIEKAQKINLDIDNFGFFVPEANGTQPMPNSFWEELANHYKNKHVDIFVNASTGISNYGKSCTLNIDEAAYIASYAKNIIALRCGFAEILSAVKRDSHIHIIYTVYKPFLSGNAQQFYQVYSLKTYPFKHNNISEYIYTDNISDILASIIKDF